MDIHIPPQSVRAAYAINPQYERVSLTFPVEFLYRGRGEVIVHMAYLEVEYVTFRVESTPETLESLRDLARDNSAIEIR